MKKSTSISRAEMKKIMGGMDELNAPCVDQCYIDAHCPKGYMCYWATFPSGGSCWRCVVPELK